MLQRLPAHSIQAGPPERNGRAPKCYHWFPFDASWTCSEVFDDFQWFCVKLHEF